MSTNLSTTTSANVFPTVGHIGPVKETKKISSPVSAQCPVPAQLVQDWIVSQETPISSPHQIIIQQKKKGRKETNKKKKDQNGGRRYDPSYPGTKTDSQVHADDPITPAQLTAARSCPRTTGSASHPYCVVILVAWDSDDRLPVPGHTATRVCQAPEKQNNQAVHARPL